jgi:ATP-dependent Clp protease ATP-binding subunit ClpC
MWPFSRKPRKLFQQEEPYEGLAGRARKVYQFATQEAQRLSHEYVGTEHILLALIAEEGGVAANALKNMDVDLRTIQLEVMKVVQIAPQMVCLGKLPWTPRAKNVIEYSIEEARQFGDNCVDTEHVLLGLLRERDCFAAAVLSSLGLDIERTRSEVRRLLGQPE